MKKRIWTMLVIVLAIGLFLIYVREIHVPAGMLKKAVEKDEKGNKTHELCNITGVDPISQLKLNYDFVIADNTYVFYIDKIEEVYSEAANEKAKLYHVIDWDIVYPIKHGTISDFFDSKRYIYSKDIS